MELRNRGRGDTWSDWSDGVARHATRSCHGREVGWPSFSEGMPNPDRATTPFDDLFRALDGETLMVDERTWRLRLYSIRELNNGVWIQLDLVGTPTYVLTLRQSLHDDSDAVISTLSRYLRISKDAPDAVVFDRILSSSLMAGRWYGAGPVSPE